MMNPILGKLIGIDQGKAVEALAALIDKYGDSHKLKVRVTIVDNALEAEAWLEEKGTL